ncbi:hypothetical protein ACFOSC_03160 [Streptantibioticus rubrisoli]|uniref:Integral membrane protein n=1 Tax=Streptantibioticus rubrisoli TaxID=1387313 RepID=A0ABT1PDN3_9ACTN|nr:hypothetical protein [Streptantibioticus rubrisoli]MCQ4042916.1 hypothetical protein [Streptantibioticus rubrisoli]
MTDPRTTPDPAEPSARRRGPADPVLLLIRRHYELCACAVDPLEIAAGLEAHGITDRTAAQFRHRDVFSLAEELYARVPRETPVDVPQQRPTADELTVYRLAWHLLPAVVCAAGTAVWCALPARGAVIGGGTLLLALAAARTALRRGPLRAVPASGGAWCVCWLLAFALYGPWSLTAAPLAATGLLACSLALPPAAWCARRFALRARAVLAVSHGLAEFAAGIRPSLLATLGLFTLALSASLATCCAVLAHGARPDPVALGGVVALGLLLFTARLLAVHGFPAVAVVGTGGACAIEVLALGAQLLGRIPVLRFCGSPTRALIGAAGPGSVQAVACATAAVALIGYAMSALGHTSAHGGDRATTHVRPALADRAVAGDPSSGFTQVP